MANFSYSLHYFALRSPLNAPLSTHSTERSRSLSSTSLLGNFLAFSVRSGASSSLAVWVVFQKGGGRLGGKLWWIPKGALSWAELNWVAAWKRCICMRNRIRVRDCAGVCNQPTASLYLAFHLFFHFVPTRWLFSALHSPLLATSKPPPCWGP